MADKPTATDVNEAIRLQAEALRNAIRREARVEGDNDNDTLFGGADDDQLIGKGGDDNLFGEGGDDLLSGGRGNDRLFGKEGDDFMVGGKGRDLLEGGEGADSLYGGDGEDRIYANVYGAGSYDNDYMDGGKGRDFLYGDAGDDTLVGGKGKDDLNGLRGIDTYVFYKGDSGLGQKADIITDETDNRAERDRIVLADTNSDEMIRLRKEGDNLIIQYTDEDEIMVLNHYRDGNYFRIEILEFADGREIDLRASTKGSREDDVLIATDHERGSRLNGGKGDDRLFASYGDDRLVGGKGADIYVFDNISGDNRIREKGNPDASRGDDVILLAQTDSDEYWRLDVKNDDLIIRFGQSSVRISDQLDKGKPGNRVETLRFADDVELSIGRLKHNAGDNLIIGREGKNDTLRGGKGDDILMGLGWNDEMFGGKGADTYLIRNNDGFKDRIREFGDKDQSIKDRINLLDNETDDPLYIYRSGDSMIIKYANHSYGQDSVVVNRQFGGGEYVNMRVEELTLNNGKPWENKEAVTYTFSTSKLEKTSGNDVLIGSSTDNKIRGGGGKDLITGEKGDDILCGDAGGDTYMFKMGDGNDTIIERFGDRSHADEDVIILMDVYDPNALNMYRDDKNLVIEYGPNESRITVKNQFLGKEPWWAVEKLVLGSNFVSELTDGNIYDFHYDGF